MAEQEPELHCSVATEFHSVAVAACASLCCSKSLHVSHSLTVDVEHRRKGSPTEICACDRETRNLPISVTCLALRMYQSVKPTLVLERSKTDCTTARMSEEEISLPIHNAWNRPLSSPRTAQLWGARFDDCVDTQWHTYNNSLRTGGGKDKCACVEKFPTTMHKQCAEVSHVCAQVTGAED